MPKVVHLTPWYWPHVGGVETHLEHIAPPLTEKGYDQTIITLQHDSSLPLTEVHGGVTIQRLPVRNPRAKTNIWSQLYRQRQLLFAADIIHLHDIFWWIIPFLPFIPRRKLFITFHGYEGNTLPKWNHVFWKRVAEKFVAGSIAIGDFQKKWFGLTPTSISYGGVDHSRVIRPKKSSVTKRIIFLGRLEADNGLMKYLEAVRQVSPRLKLQLDVYGEGNLRQTAEKYVAKYHLPVTFHGFVAEASKLLPQYEVAFVSRYLSILESLNAGIPVVAQYDNELQKDYLQLAPFASGITIAQTADEIAVALLMKKTVVAKTQAWAKAQGWDRVAADYHTLWKSL